MITAECLIVLDTMLAKMLANPDYVPTDEERAAAGAVVAVEASNSNSAMQKEKW